LASSTSERWTLYRVEYILQPMKSLLVKVDDEEAEEQATAEAYARQPDNPDAGFDPATWESRGFAEPYENEK
jgi:hypothetical protein